VSFKGSVRVPRFLGEMMFCFSMLMPSLWNFLDHRAAFRLQVSQLVIEEV